ncbi:MAG: aa3-type cytochrome c oxidase subunit IV [Rhodospirillales bacterium]|nr:aa3-type cytochrome c oxidase subunit IV [Rhodospirillales bacterium]MCB9996947.1 aa3-type cytochrome c oxidase subunit IV [Rhodospirillales bacterium]
MWHGFTKVMTWGVIGVAALLLLMLIFVY